MMESLSIYRRRLEDVSGRLAKIQDKGTTLFVRWLRQIEGIEGAPRDRTLLRRHTAEVLKSAQAIVILAERHCAQPSRVSLDRALVALTKATRELRSDLEAADSVLGDRGLKGVIGGSIVSVEFVMDYVNIHFEDSTLTAISLPKVHESGQRHVFGQAGYRDALCSFVSRTVVDVSDDGAEEIALVFGNGAKISISIRTEDRIGPESATFSSGSGVLIVWN